VRELITSSVRVSPEEAFFIYEQQRTTVTARFVEAKAAWFGRFAIDTSEAAGQHFLAANGALVDAAWESEKAKWTDGCPLVSEILFQYPVGADAETRAQIQERAHQAQQLLKDGASFENVARAFSDGDQARLGGALGCLSEAYGPVHEDLAKAVSSLSAGQRSPAALETPKGLHLLKLDGKLAAADLERLGKLYVARGIAADKAQLERAQAFGKAVIAAAESGKGLKEAMDELVSAEIVFDKAKSADPTKRNIAEKLLSAALASELAPRFDISRAVARGTSPLPGLVDGSVTGKLLALSKDDALLPDVVSTPGGAVVLQLKEKDVATRESFDKDKERAVESLLEQKRTETLSAYIEKLRAATKKINISQKYTSGSELPSNEPSDG
jgi:parvulin-like peptidyl-prolyl isomerase